MSETGKPQVCIVMGSTSDLPTMEAAIDMLKEFDIPYVVRVLSAHRTPNETLKLAEEAMDNGIRVFIAGAGGAAHLAAQMIGLADPAVMQKVIDFKKAQAEKVLANSYLDK